MAGINTIKLLRQAIKKAKTVYMTPRFGTNERYVKVSKKDVLLVNRRVFWRRNP